MKERPILMSAPMVRAILDGRKTQTRRVVKDPEYYGCITGDCPHCHQEECDAAMALACPYGKPGDRLWVKETHRHPSKEHPRVRVDYRADMMSWGICDSHDVMGGTVTANAKVFACPVNEYSKQHWRPSIFMPRWASRITLEITGVRVERLISISAEDAVAEGIEFVTRTEAGKFYKNFQNPDCPCLPYGAYRSLWEDINGAGSWDKNPWVWVIEFKADRLRNEGAK